MPEYRPPRNPVRRNDMPMDLGTNMKLDTSGLYTCSPRNSNTMDWTAHSSNEASSSVKHLIVVVDFGTTFTRVGVSANGGAPRAITNWPHANREDQVPTELWYGTTPPRRSSPDQRFDGTESKDYSDNESDIGDSTKQKDDPSSEVFWGWGVRFQKFARKSDRDMRGFLQLLKLPLIDADWTEKDGLAVRQVVEYLISTKLIRKFGKQKVPDARDIRDPISDFLTRVLEHTKQQVQTMFGFNDQWTVSFGLTVPVVWSQASSRILQQCMEDAVRASSWGPAGEDALGRLDFTPEPEAAATYMLSDPHMLPGTVVSVMDCGGGTTDIVTYDVADNYEYPLQFKGQTVPPDGINAAGNSVNSNLALLYHKRLSGVSTIEKMGSTPELVVTKLVQEFERDQKREVNISISQPAWRVEIPLLAANARKRFVKNHMIVENKPDFESVFLPVLRTMSSLPRRQLEAARERGKWIDVFFLVGGFAACPSVASYFGNFIQSMAELIQPGHPIKVIQNDRKCASAVVLGAVLRMMNDKKGPDRHAQSSYGFLQYEQWQPLVHAGHVYAETEQDEFDGETQVGVLNYFMVKDTLIPAEKTYGPIELHHAFLISEKQWICRETLYVSDSATDSHYTLQNPKNRDAQIVGYIEADMTFLKKRKKLKCEPPKFDEHGKPIGKRHYLVKWDIYIIVRGLNMRYEARYPASIKSDRDRVIQRRHSEVVQSNQVSIAAAFRVGCEGA